MLQPARLTHNGLLLLLVIGLAVLAGCAGQRASTNPSKPDHVAAFSTAQLGEPHPLEWQPWIISRFNRRTEYRVVEEDGQRVLLANSDQAASGLLQEIRISPSKLPHLRWRWRVPKLLEGADLSRKGSDDSPVRVIVSFDGDLGKLDIEERAMASLVKLASGRDMPYATLMYVWDNNLPAGTMLENPHSSRVKMFVVEGGPGRTGQWLQYSRNVAADFRKAFGEPPGAIISVGVMTDSNRTETKAIAYYGDIGFSDKPE
jgi:hypothetical protein